MPKQEVITISGGINQDSSDLKLPQGMVRDQMNIRTLNSDTDLDGIAETVRSNAQVDFPLPPGTNRVIGTYEDQQNRSVNYLVYNSTGEHRVLQYKAGVDSIGKIYNHGGGAALNFQEDEVITGIGAVDGLMYWCSEENPHRKYNMDRSSAEKPWCFEVYFEEIPDGTTQRTISVSGTSASSSFNEAGFYVATGTDLGNISALSRGFATAWNANTNLNTHFTAEACGNYVKLTATQNGFWSISLSGTDIVNLTSQPAAAHAQPANSYISLNDRILDWAKSPPECAPLAYYDNDLDRDTNFLTGKNFRFSVRYYYVDGEVSILSKYSNPPIDEQACSGVSNNNYILVDFTDSWLSDPAELCDIEEVEILVSEFEVGGWGLWRSVKRIRREDFFFDQTFRFYNDGNYAVIDPSGNTATKLQEALPLRSKALAFIKDDERMRLAIGNTVEGYDDPCIDFDYEIRYNDIPSQTLGLVTCLVQIINPFASSSGFNAWRNNQPIHQYDPNGWPVYGGTDYTSLTANGNIVIDTKTGTIAGGNFYDRRIPEGGPIMYSAGRREYAVGVQHAPTITLPCGSFQPTFISGTNIYDTSQGGYNSNPCNKTYRAALYEAMLTGAVFCRVDLYLPPGRHKIRFANPRCSSGDVLGLGDEFDLDRADLLWQSTSGPFIHVGTNTTANITPGLFECEVVIPDTGGTFDIGRAYMVDMVLAGSSNSSTIHEGYLFNKDGLEQSGSNDVRTGNSMERQLIAWMRSNAGETATVPFNAEAGATHLSTTFGLPEIDVIFNQNRTITDHNGYFFWAYEDLKPSTDFIRAAQLAITGNPLSPIGALLGFTPTAVTVANLTILRDIKDDHNTGRLTGTVTVVAGGNLESDPTLAEYIFANNSPTADQYVFTNVQGQILDQNGSGLQGVTVTLKGGRWVKTDPQGNYSIPAHGDMGVGDVIGANANERTTAVCVNYDGSCEITLTPDMLPALIKQYEANQAYSKAVPFPLSNITGTVFSYGGGVLKRGGVYFLHLDVYDRMGRFPFASTAKRVEIPYPTENGIIGYPEIEITITSPAPSLDIGYFTHLVPVLSKNQRVSSFLQWSVSDIRYIQTYDTASGTPIVSSYGSATARQIEIKLDFQLYADENPGSIINYTFEEGDKLLFLYNEDGTVFPTHRILDIKEQVSPGIIVVENQASFPELKPGMIIEILKLRVQQEQLLLYERGPCIEIDNGQFSATTFTLEAWDTHIVRRSIPTREYYDPGSPPSPLPTLQRFQGVMESENVNDRFVSSIDNAGRPNTIAPELGQLVKPTQLQISDGYFFGNTVNGFGSWQGLNGRETNRIYGSIQYMSIVGDRMVVLHQFETVTIYIGKEVVKSVDGNDLQTVADKVLSSVYELQGDFGTHNPESAAQYGGYLYYWDMYKGVVVRYSNNGLFVISERFWMSDFFHDKGKNQMKFNDMIGRNPRVYGVFDRRFSEYIICFEETTLDSASQARTPSDTFEINPEVIPALTISFFEAGVDSSRWHTRYSYYPEQCSSIGNEIVTFLNGELWIHNRGLSYCTFYGVKTNPQIKVTAGRENYHPKRVFYISMEQIASVAWPIRVSRIIERGQVLMQSQLPAPWWVKREEDFYASFLRDELTPNQPNAQQSLVSGRKLRGHSMEMTLELDTDQYETLEMLIVKHEHSERSIR